MPARQDSTWMAWSEKPGHVPGFLFRRERTSNPRLLSVARSSMLRRRAI
jgi:hypothetical protein